MTKIELEPIIDWQDLTLGELALIHAEHEYLASGQRSEPSPVDYARGWLIAHMDMEEHGAMQPTHDDDDVLGLPHGTLEIGLKQLATDGQLGIMNCGCFGLVFFDPSLH